MSILTFRHSLKRRCAHVSLRIRGGPLKGRRWSAFTGTRFLRGTYEPYISSLLARELKPGGTFLDIGSHVGYFAVLGGQLVGPKGRVFAFEPRDLNLVFLRLHLAWNDLPNVTVLPLCVGDRTGFITFDSTVGTGVGRISATGNEQLPITTLDAFCAEHGGLRPDFVKIDVEGAEAAVLAGGRSLFAARSSRFLIATHGLREREDVEKFLTDVGYQWEWVDERQYEGHGDLLAWSR